MSSLPVKTGITLSADAHRRLKTAGLVDGQNFSEIIEGLIQTYLVGYYAGKRGQAATGEEAAAA